MLPELMSACTEKCIPNVISNHCGTPLIVMDWAYVLTEYRKPSFFSVVYYKYKQPEDIVFEMINQFILWT